MCVLRCSSTSDSLGVAGIRGRLRGNTSSSRHGVQRNSSSRASTSPVASPTAISSSSQDWAFRCTPRSVVPLMLMADLWESRVAGVVDPMPFGHACQNPPWA